MAQCMNAAADCIISQIKLRVLFLFFDTQFYMHHTQRMVHIMPLIKDFWTHLSFLLNGDGQMMRTIGLQ